jgi:GDPmannose 4,6-dehydratase
VSSQGQIRRALVTGLSGQDGSFLAELLLEKGYRVTGFIRRCAVDLGAAEHLRDRVDVVHGDLLDHESLGSAVNDIRPDELYHLAAPSFVPETWRHPAQAVTAITGATATLLEAVRDHSPDTRIFVAASGAMFGATSASPQHEDSPAWPQTPYGAAKLAAHQLVGQLRGHDGLFACSGILYNHESERRPQHFVTRKIARAAAAIRLGLEREVVLGDLEAVRDWTFAGDVMLGAWKMLQHDSPDDYILASGIGHTVREFARVAFAHVGLDADDHIRVDPDLVRGPEPVPLVGDPSRARVELGWRPTIEFEQLVRRMVECDLASLGSEDR